MGVQSQLNPLKKSSVGGIVEDPNILKLGDIVLCNDII